MTGAKVCFNLGYLPGTDKKIITETDVTMRATEAAMLAVAQFGCVSLTCYTGDEPLACHGPSPAGGATGVVWRAPFEGRISTLPSYVSCQRGVTADSLCTSGQVHSILLPELSLVLPM